MRLRFLLAAPVLSLTALLVPLASSAHATQYQDELIPATIYPGTQTPTGSSTTGMAVDKWLCDHASTDGDGSVVVFSPALSGISAADSNYTSIFRHCANENGGSGVTPVAYIDTGYGGVSETAAKAEIGNVAAYYPGAQGVFFDEVPTSPTASTCPASDCETYYGDLISYARSKISDAQVTGNMGAAPATDWPLSMTHEFDLVAIFEGTESSFTSWSPPSWLDGSEYDSVAALVHDSSSGDASAVCTATQDDGIGYGANWGSPAWTSDPSPTGDGTFSSYLTAGC